MSLFSELRRRNVFRFATAYVVAAWLIVQVVGTLFPIFGFADEASRLVVILLAIGFVPAVIGAWVFQLTPQGLKLDFGGTESAPGASRLLDRMIIVTLLLGISYFAIDKFMLAPGRIAEREAEVAAEAADEARKGFYGDRSIAVLPFANMSSDPEQLNFADGIAEEVLNLLARVRQLRVISRSSAFALRGRNLAVPEIAEILDVGHVLEGSVRKEGDRVRVTVQLIEARTDTHLWSQTYTENFDDVFRIQDEIAADVARNLRITLLQPLPRSRFVDPEVKSLTDQARLLSQTRPDGVGAKMYQLLSQALDIDPNYVPALELMTSADYFRRREGLITDDEERQRYKSFIERILQLDPDNAMDDYTRAFDAEVAGRLEDAAELYLHALSKDMTDSDWVRLAGGFARRIGRFDASKRLLEHTVAIDPMCFQCLYQLSRTYLVSGDYDRALEARERYLALGSGGFFHYGLMLLLSGQPQAALDYMATMPETEADHALPIKVMARYSLGDQAQAEAGFAALVARWAEEDPFTIAEVAAWMDDTDAAFEWLSKAPRDEAAQHLLNPVFASLHDDPRWNAFRDSVGMSAARLEAIEFDPAMPQ